MKNLTLEEKLKLAEKRAALARDLVGGTIVSLTNFSIPELTVMREEYLTEAEDIAKNCKQVKKLRSKHPRVKTYDDYMNASAAIGHIIHIRKLINSI